MNIWNSIMNGVGTGISGIDTSFDQWQSNRIANGQRPVPIGIPGAIASASQIANDIKNSFDSTYSGTNNSGQTSYVSYSGSSAPQIPEYIDAPLAHHYGMDSATAYQEALANTSYQRKVKDLKAAGLNPVLGVQGSGSAVFSGDSLNSGSTVSGRSSGKSDYSGLPYIVNGLFSLAFGARVGQAAGNVAKGLVQSGAIDKLLN